MLTRLFGRKPKQQPEPEFSNEEYAEALINDLNDRGDQLNDAMRREFERRVAEAPPHMQDFVRKFADASLASAQTMSEQIQDAGARKIREALNKPDED